MTTLRDFIASRETDIKAQIKALRVELNDLKLAKSALDSHGSALVTQTPLATTKTIKDMIREVLKSNADGLTSTEILAKINDQTDRQIERTSLSPQLSRMKEDGEVALTENLWFLAVAPESLEYIPRPEPLSVEDIREFSTASSKTSYNPFGDDGDIDIPF